jgi:hypothetical protein
MDEKDFDNLQDMFLTDGWKYLQTQLSEQEALFTKVAPDSAVTNDQWQYLRGKIHQLRVLLGYETTVNIVWDQEQNALASAPPEDNVNVDFI